MLEQGTILWVKGLLVMDKEKEVFIRIKVKDEKYMKFMVREKRLMELMEQTLRKVKRKISVKQKRKVFIENRWYCG